MMDGAPCKVLGVTKSKPGKHGSTKARVDGIGIFDNQKRGILKPTDATIEAPVIEKSTAQVISVSGTTVQLMDLSTYATFDITAPQKLEGGPLESGKEVEYMMFESLMQITRVR
ncbi:MAG: translation initiation factor IF-5A [Candidatus Diapherotrites archaeon]|nr:translation initiation factor IF-5A [Candidatus Diapherotrites archaeon]